VGFRYSGAILPSSAPSCGEKKTAVPKGHRQGRASDPSPDGTNDCEVDMQRKEKEALVEEVSGLLAAADVMYVSDYRGLTVAEITELRSKLRPVGASVRVLKNTLTRRAAEATGHQELLLLLNGPTAITICGDDPVAPAKALADFARTHEKLVVRGGVMQGKVLDAAGIKTLATLPAREALLAQVVGVMAAPLAGLVTVLNGTLSGLARALQQVADQKAAAA
jgi:large subunit ribosomal protein L10